MHSLESLDGRRFGAWRVRHRIAGDAAAPFSLAGGCGAYCFRPGTPHAVPRNLPAVPRRPAFQSPRARYRRPGRIADERAGDGPDRAQHDGTGQGAKCSVACALRERGGGHEHQEQCGYAVGLDHISVPSVEGGILICLYGEMRDALWLDHGLSGSMGRSAPAVALLPARYTA